MSTNERADSSQQRVAKAVELMDFALYASTGLQERDRKLVTYWTLATHMLPHVDMFPLLVLRGKMATGKSETLKIIAKFAYQSHPFNPRGKTLPVIREELAVAYEGTAIIEEADKVWNDGSSAFERLLSDRYQRQSAEAGLMQKHGDQWVPTTKRTFGATALHSRIPFNDSALDGRSITIRYRDNSTRQYTEVSDDLPWIVEGSELTQGLVFTPIAIDQPQTVSARIFNTYRPLFVIARLCGDEAFAQWILESLMLDTAQLKEAQSVEPDGLVLRAIISIVGAPPCFANIKLGDIANCIWDNHRESFQSKQIGGLARELGFTTKVSHGWTVVVPTPVTLLKACHECGCEDEETMAELKRHILRSGERVEEVEEVGEVE